MGKEALPNIDDRFTIHNVGPAVFQQLSGTIKEAIKQNKRAL